MVWLLQGNMKTNLTNTADAVGNPTNDGEQAILLTAPFAAEVTIEGSCPLLLHRWSCEAVAEKAASKKGSEAKRTDNVESYVYRTADGHIAIPGQYLIGSITNPKNGAAKYLQDPRSPRKSALDLFRAGIVPLTELASTGKPVWDYLDQRRVTVQGSGITRTRPALHPGWTATFQLQVLTPEYISKQLLLVTLVQAGRLVGIGDFRPTYGRFAVTRFQVL